MVFFIPRVVAEEIRRAHYGFGGATLLDLSGPAPRLPTDVADFHFSDIAVRGGDGATVGPRRQRCLFEGFFLMSPPPVFSVAGPVASAYFFTMSVLQLDVKRSHDLSLPSAQNGLTHELSGKICANRSA